jgi:hypothetical protein
MYSVGVVLKNTFDALAAAAARDAIQLDWMSGLRAAGGTGVERCR